MTLLILLCLAFTEGILTGCIPNVPSAVLTPSQEAKIPKRTSGRQPRATKLESGLSIQITAISRSLVRFLQAASGEGVLPSENS